MIHMAKTQGSIEHSQYPIGARALFARTGYATKWDNGATTFDERPVLWDANDHGAQYTRKPHPQTIAYTPTMQPATTWDTDAANWDNYSTTWDNTRGPDAPANAYTAAKDRYDAIAAQWAALDRWKKGRWTLCGLKRRMNGRALYLQCAAEQQTPIGKQPISPCSRRATDPLASPFDFTP